MRSSKSSKVSRAATTTRTHTPAINKFIIKKNTENKQTNKIKTNGAHLIVLRVLHVTKAEPLPPRADLEVLPSPASPVLLKEPPASLNVSRFVAGGQVKLYQRRLIGGYSVQRNVDLGEEPGV